MKACEDFMHLNNHDMKKGEIVLKFINLVLKCNNLTFRGQHYVQLQEQQFGSVDINVSK